MAYSISRSVPTDSLRTLATWLLAELTAIAAAVNEPAPRWVTYDELHAEPSKLRTGMTVLADGTDWNPGSGAGVYTYYGAAWHKLG